MSIRARPFETNGLSAKVYVHDAPTRSKPGARLHPALVLSVGPPSSVSAGTGRKRIAQDPLQFGEGCVPDGVGAGAKMLIERVVSAGHDPSLLRIVVRIDRRLTGVIRSGLIVGAVVGEGERDGSWAATRDDPFPPVVVDPGVA